MSRVTLLKDLSNTSEITEFLTKFEDDKHVWCDDYDFGSYIINKIDVLSPNKQFKNKSKVIFKWLNICPGCLASYYNIRENMANPENEEILQKFDDERLLALLRTSENLNMITITEILTYNWKCLRINEIRFFFIKLLKIFYKNESLLFSKMTFSLILLTQCGDVDLLLHIAKTFKYLKKQNLLFLHTNEEEWEYLLSFGNLEENFFPEKSIVVKQDWLLSTLIYLTLDTTHFSRQIIDYVIAIYKDTSDPITREMCFRVCAAYLHRDISQLENCKFIYETILSSVPDQNHATYRGSMFLKNIDCAFIDQFKNFCALGFEQKICDYFGTKKIFIGQIKEEMLTNMQYIKPSMKYFSSDFFKNLIISLLNSDPIGDNEKKFITNSVDKFINRVYTNLRKNTIDVDVLAQAFVVWSEILAESCGNYNLFTDFIFFFIYEIEQILLKLSNTDKLFDILKIFKRKFFAVLDLNDERLSDEILLYKDFIKSDFSTYNIRTIIFSKGELEALKKILEKMTVYFERYRVFPRCFERLLGLIQKSAYVDYKVYTEIFNFAWNDKHLDQILETLTILLPRISFDVPVEKTFLANLEWIDILHRVQGCDIILIENFVLAYFSWMKINNIVSFPEYQKTQIMDFIEQHEILQVEKPYYRKTQTPKKAGFLKGLSEDEMKTMYEQNDANLEESKKLFEKTKSENKKPNKSENKKPNKNEKKPKENEQKPKENDEQNKDQKKTLEHFFNIKEKPKQKHDTKVSENIKKSKIETIIDPLPEKETKKSDNDDIIELSSKPGSKKLNTVFSSTNNTQENSNLIERNDHKNDQPSKISNQRHEDITKQDNFIVLPEIISSAISLDYPAEQSNINTINSNFTDYKLQTNIEQPKNDFEINNKIRYSVPFTSLYPTAHVDYQPKIESETSPYKTPYTAQKNTYQNFSYEIKPKKLHTNFQFDSKNNLIVTNNSLKQANLESTKHLPKKYSDLMSNHLNKPSNHSIKTIPYEQFPNEFNNLNQNVNHAIVNPNKTSIKETREKVMAHFSKNKQYNKVALENTKKVEIALDEHENLFTNVFFEKVLSFDYQNKDEFELVDKIPSIFETYKEYENVFEPLLLNECKETLFKVLTEITEGMAQKCKLVCEATIDNFFELTIQTVERLPEMQVLLLSQLKFDEIIKLGHFPKKHCFLGIVIDFKQERDSQAVIITQNNINKPLLNTSLYYYSLSCFSSSYREFMALKNLKFFPHLSSILVQKNDSSPPLLNNIKLLNLYLEPERLNESQNLAIRHVFTNRSFFSLIHGPPGTGKTRTIVSTVKMFFHPPLMNSFRNHIQFENSTPRILICAPSNNAVDEIARRIIKLRFSDRTSPMLRVIRVGVPNNINEDLKDYTLENLIENELKAKRRITGLPTLEFTPQEKMKKRFEYLKQSDVVCATLSSSAKEMIKIANISFDILIIDEACQSVETSTLIPLKFEPYKVILIGDPRQLPPTVLSQSKPYQHCLFERLMKTHPAIFLNTQYRMHPQIAEFPNKFFYDNLLLTHKSVADRRSPYEDFLQPISFIRMQTDDKLENNYSFVNTGEARIVAEIIQELIKRVHNYDLTNKIGIITPYRAQQYRIRSLLVQIREDIFKFVSVNTVDGFQGQEKDIIIISAVRSKNIGFLNDIRRMNVSITRAKFSLIILGNVQTLSKSQTWKAMIKYFNEKGAIYDHWKNLFIRK